MGHAKNKFATQGRSNKMKVKKTQKSDTLFF